MHDDKSRQAVFDVPDLTGDVDEDECAVDSTQVLINRLDRAATLRERLARRLGDHPRTSAATGPLALPQRQLRTPSGEVYALGASFDAVIVRPPSAKLTARLRAVAQNAGLQVDDAEIIKARTPDDEVVKLLAGAASRTLIVPFHPHRDIHGERVDGVNLTCRIFRELPQLAECPVLLVVSTFATAFRLVLSNVRRAGELTDDLEARIMLVHEPELDDPDLPRAIAKHLAYVRRSTRGTGSFRKVTPES